MCILFVYIVKRLSMSVMGFQKSLDGVGGPSSIQFHLGFLDNFNFEKPLTTVYIVFVDTMIWRM